MVENDLIYQFVATFHKLKIHVERRLWAQFVINTPHLSILGIEQKYSFN